jgi:Asp-tRNA(Asn)/Glu-tRNA(Gln) amidotransferase A subunit family amidase
LQQIVTCEPSVQAWEYFNPELIEQQIDQIENHSQPESLPLKGLPIAIKDIIATADMPTGWGTPIHAGTMRGYDAAVVEKLRSAGAILMGKTVTTEYATARAGKTTNPHHAAHTPGGSSSGSAAAVAAGMVPVAIGTQTLGSILRPAAYCGVIGFKPSFGTISRYGIMSVSRELDHVGIFARSLADITRVCSILAESDERDPDCRGGIFLPPIETESGIKNELIKIPKFALIQTPFWNQIESEDQQRVLDCASQIEQAGGAIANLTLPPSFETFPDIAHVLMSAGLAAHHGQDADQYPEQISPALHRWIERGRSQSAVEYAQARQTTVHYSITLAHLLAQYDAILTPVTMGTAPLGLENTGSPLFCILWTLCGLPAISIPMGKASNGLPLAVQLVGRRGGDRQLLAVAQWLMDVS